MNKRFVCRVSEDGQILLPPEIHELLGFGRVECEVKGERVILKKTTPDYVFQWTPASDRGDHT